MSEQPSHIGRLLPFTAMLCISICARMFMSFLNTIFASSAADRMGRCDFPSTGDLVRLTPRDEFIG